MLPPYLLCRVLCLLFEIRFITRICITGGSTSGEDEESGGELIGLETKVIGLKTKVIGLEIKVIGLERKVILPETKGIGLETNVIL